MAEWRGNMACSPIAAIPAQAGMAALFAGVPLAASVPARAAPSTRIDTIAANAPNLPPLHSPAFGGDSARAVIAPFAGLPPPRVERIGAPTSRSCTIRNGASSAW